MPKPITTAEIYAMGYALPSYDCSRYERTWQFKDETFRLPADAVMLHIVDGLQFYVANIEDVREAASKAGASFTVESVYG